MAQKSHAHALKMVQTGDFLPHLDASVAVHGSPDAEKGQ
jgi:hypothetical protein